MHGQDAAGNEFSVLPDAEMPRLYSHHVIKHELQVQTALHTHLRRPAESYTHTKIITLNITLNNTHLSEHGFAVLRDHSTLIAVQRHEVVVERLFRVFQDVVELVSAALKHTPEVTRNQRPTDR